MSCVLFNLLLDFYNNEMAPDDIHVDSKWTCFSIALALQHLSHSHTHSCTECKVPTYMPSSSGAIWGWVSCLRILCAASGARGVESAISWLLDGPTPPPELQLPHMYTHTCMSANNTFAEAASYFVQRAMRIWIFTTYFPPNTYYV